VKRLSDEALSVLSAEVEVRGASVVLTSPRLDRKLYVEVNAALEAIGGKWNRKAQAHLFESDPAEALAEILVDGGFADRKRDLDQFFTPPELAKEIAELADVGGKDVLEPSAGHGALVLASLTAGARRVVSVEKDEKAHEALCWMKYPNGSHCPYTPCDFMALVEDHRYDRVVMNPPFSKQQDIAHVTKAFGLLKPGGKLVAILSAGVEFRSDKKTAAFRRLMADSRGTLTRLAEHAFRSSGTDVRTIVVIMTRPR